MTAGRTAQREGTPRGREPLHLPHRAVTCVMCACVCVGVGERAALEAWAYSLCSGELACAVQCCWDTMEG